MTKDQIIDVARQLDSLLMKASGFTVQESLHLAKCMHLLLDYLSKSSAQESSNEE